jgi:hypothetical protein
MRGGATEVNETQKWATSKKKVENHCPRSPYLFPLDFFLWGHLKSVVYASHLQTTEALKECNQEESDKISIDTLQAFAKSTKRRVYVYQSLHELQFEHLLE